MVLHIDRYLEVPSFEVRQLTKDLMGSNGQAYRERKCRVEFPKYGRNRERDRHVKLGKVQPFFLTSFATKSSYLFP